MKRVLATLAILALLLVSCNETEQDAVNNALIESGGGITLTISD